MCDVTMLARAGQLVTAYDQPPIPNGAIAIAGSTIKAVGTYNELSQRYQGVKAGTTAYEMTTRPE